MKNLIKILFIFCCTITTFAQIPDELDTSFGTNGHVEHTVTPNNDLMGIFIHDSYKLPNGKILAVGTANDGCGSVSGYYGIVIRFNVDGSIDTSFSQNGFYITNSTHFRQIIVENNNSFYIKSSSSLLNIDSNGSIITSFTTPNVLKVFLDSNNDFITINKIGSTYKIGKMSSNGSINNTFGDNGYYTVPSNFKINKITLDESNNIYAVGYDNTDPNLEKLIVLKLNSNGLLDTTFATNGIYKFEAYTRSHGFFIQIDQQNRLLITGIRPGDYNYNRGLLMLRLDLDGSIDTSFSGNGYFFKNIHSDSTPRKIHLTTNGEIYVTGQGFYRMYIAKFNENGFSDISFGTNGSILTEYLSTTIYATSSIMYNDNIILIGAKMFAHCNQSKYKATLSKYLIDNNRLNTNETTLINSTKIFPNPIKNKIVIQTESLHYKIKLFDALGKRINVNVNNDIIDARSLNSGVYYLHITSNLNTKIVKLIK